MQSTTPFIYTDQSKFDILMNNLAHFRESTDPTKQRLQILFQNSTFLVDVRSKPNFWKRLCQFFYKPRHLRIKNIVNSALDLLKANEKFLYSVDNLEKLKAFRSRITTISNYKIKIPSQIIQKLNALINQIEENQNKKLAEAEKKANELVVIFQREKEQEEAIQRNLRNEVQIRIDELSQQIQEQTKLNETQEITTSRYNVMTQWSLQFLYEDKKASLLKNLYPPKGDCDLILHFFDGIVSTHLFLFPNTIKIRTSFSIKNPAPIKIDTHSSKTMENLLKICYSYSVETIRLTLEQTLELYCLAEDLGEKVVRPALKDSVIKYLNNFKILALEAVRVHLQNRYCNRLLDHFDNLFVKLLDDLTLVELTSIPKSILKNHMHLMSNDKRYQAITKKWELWQII